MKIPFRRYRGGALVEVQINDKYTEWMLFDTGAANTFITDAAARRCGLRPHMIQQSVFFLGRGKVTARPVGIDTLRVGDRAFSKKQLLAYVIPEDDHEDEYAGILGMDVIAEMGWFSVNATHLTLHRSMPVLRSHIRLPAIVQERRCWFPVRLGNGQPIRLIWDTGAAINRLSPNILASQLQRRGGKSAVVPQGRHELYAVLEDGTEEEAVIEYRRLWRFGDATIGTLLLHPMPVFQYHDVFGWGWGEYGLLGFPMLTEYEITADFTTKRLFARRYRQRVAGTYGLALRAEERRGALRWFFSAVIPTEEGAPLPPHLCEILAVDGIPVERWETIPLIQRLMFPQARQTCSVRYFDGRRVMTNRFRAVGVAYLGLPLLWMHTIRLPRSELKFEGGYLRSRMTLEIPKQLRGVRGSRRRLYVEYRDDSWRFG